MFAPLHEGSLVKALRHLGDTPAGVRLLADDVLEFHAARILLLLRVCGTANRIDGLTKLAKLDFFVRYPKFFERAVGSPAATDSTESSMVRFHYGPWDHRYYHVLAYLEGAGLLRIDNVGGTIRLDMTEQGKHTADSLRSKPAFESLVAQMTRVKQALGKKTGSALKKFIYGVFEEEVANRKFGEQIR
jgi:hypothetical protein